MLLAGVMSRAFSDGGHPLYATMTRCTSTNDPSRSPRGHPEFLTRKRAVSTPTSRRVNGSDDVEHVTTCSSVINEASESDDDNDDDNKSDYVFYSPADPSSPASPSPSLPPASAASSSSSSSSAAAAAAACHDDCRNRAQSAAVDSLLRPRVHSHSHTTQASDELQLHVSFTASQH